MLRKKLFKGLSSDIFPLLLGLSFLYVLALMGLPAYFIALAVSILQSLVFAYINTDEKDFYCPSKDPSFLEVFTRRAGSSLFAIFFGLGFFFLAWLILGLINSLGFLKEPSPHIYLILSQSLLVMGLENIFLNPRLRSVKSYPPGPNKEVARQMEAGLDNLAYFIPSLLINIFSIILLIKVLPNLTITSLGLFLVLTILTSTYLACKNK